MPLAYLPRYDYELGSAVLGGGIVAIGLWNLVTGRAPGRFRTRFVRAAGAVQLLVGAGTIASGFLVNAESPDEPRPVDHWGDTWDLAALAIWLALLGAMGVSIVRQYRKGS
jgi:MFS family permease